MSRGCGERAENALYAVCETSPYGKPIEHFLVDPVIEWKGSRLRAPMLVPDKDGVKHILLGVGAHYYPYVPDFVEEARRLGVSKRIPRDFDITALTPKHTKMILLHRRGIPLFKYQTTFKCPKAIESKHECIGALWPLSTFKSYKNTHMITLETEGKAQIHTPSANYIVNIPEKPKTIENPVYKSGIFIQVPISRFEFVNKQGKAPNSLKKKMDKQGFKFEVCPT